MEEIRVYHIQWKMWVLILECIAFVAMGCFLLQDNDINRVFVWIGISFSGICGLFILYLLMSREVSFIPCDEGRPLQFRALHTPLALS